MKKKIFITSIVVLSITLTVVGFKCKQNQLPDFGHFLINAEALAESEQGNEWESNYQYCRCKEVNNTKGCYSGNAISTRPACHKAAIGSPLHCNNYNDNCN